MRYIFLLLILAGVCLSAATVSAEIYKYIDPATGRTLFTDDLSNVPQNQREKVETRDEYVAPIEIEPEMKNADRGNTDDEETVGISKAELDEREAAINERQEALKQEKAELDEEQKTLEEMRKTLKTKDHVKVYEEKVKVHNQRVKELTEKTEDLNKEVAAYNDDVTEWLRSKGPKTGEDSE